MDPSSVITWAVCLGIAWLIFASITGVDDWLKSLFGKSKESELEERIGNLEKKLEEIARK